MAVQVRRRARPLGGAAAMAGAVQVLIRQHTSVWCRAWSRECCISRCRVYPCMLQQPRYGEAERAGSTKMYTALLGLSASMESSDLAASCGQHNCAL